MVWRWIYVGGGLAQLPFGRFSTASASPLTVLA
jgi:hypothetical protein